MYKKDKVLDCGESSMHGWAVYKQYQCFQGGCESLEYGTVGRLSLPMTGSKVGKS